MSAAGISVVCITHRKGELLREAMAAVVAQLLPGDELLVIDDGGDDRPLVAALMNPAADHPRVRYVWVPHRGYRLSLLCNLGVMLAANDRIVKIDGDIVPKPGWLQAYRRCLTKGTLVCGRIEWRDPAGGLQRDSRFDYAQRRGRVAPRKSYGGNLGFERNDLLLLGLFDTCYHGAWGAEDAEIGEKYRLSGRQVLFSFDAAVEHQWHPPCKDRRNAARNRRLLRQRVALFERGRRPRACRRDVLRIVVDSAVDGAALDGLCAGLSLPYAISAKPWAEVLIGLGANEIALHLRDPGGMSAGTIEQLYAYLKADERCRAVAPATPRDACVLTRGVAKASNVVTLAATPDIAAAPAGAAAGPAGSC